MLMKKKEKEIPVRGIEPRAARYLNMEVKTSDVSHYTMPDCMNSHFVF